ncbi:MAG: methylenetetrahydrofolate reductase [Deltaproteobacteria bacterium]|jgi:methylenetetrahydrofolate reductase (NADPH)|nr:methylenetetrahydrofolate reductase [Deltaproteobacteria bacterium]MCW9049993.1 methylenetetrahydrofolate reductase [Deltaproteobacteria bacterium]
MTEISLELVPRSEVSLRKELEQVRNKFPAIERINIPDILRFDLHSWDACSIASEYFPKTIPHLRAIDFDPNVPLELVESITRKGVEAVLVITGDPPQDMSHKIYRTSCLEMIRRLKRELPQIKIFAGMDPYRSGIKEEIDYILAKRDAGAEAFFTQPFFDLRLMEIYQGFLQDFTIYWGVSPVLTENSRNYWENKNNAVFPPDFVPTLKWNRNFARKALKFAQSHGGNLYFMPIRTDIAAYLDGII